MIWTAWNKGGFGWGHGRACGRDFEVKVKGWDCDGDDGRDGGSTAWKGWKTDKGWAAKKHLKKTVWKRDCDDDAPRWKRDDDDRGWKKKRCEDDDRGWTKKRCEDDEDRGWTKKRCEDDDRGWKKKRCEDNDRDDDHGDAPTPPTPPLCDWPLPPEPENTAPVITGPAGPVPMTPLSEGRIVATIAAFDADGDTLIFALDDTAPDAGLFSIDAATGAITATGPLGEMGSANRDSIYELEATVTDGQASDRIDLVLEYFTSM